MANVKRVTLDNGETPVSAPVLRGADQRETDHQDGDLP